MYNGKGCLIAYVHTYLGEGDVLLYLGVGNGAIPPRIGGVTES